MKKFLLALAILACTMSVFACEGYTVSAEGIEECFSSCSEAKLHARDLLRKGKKSVRIDASRPSIQSGCNGKTYHSTEEIN